MWFHIECYFKKNLIVSHKMEQSPSNFALSKT